MSSFRDILPYFGPSAIGRQRRSSFDDAIWRECRSSRWRLRERRRGWRETDDRAGSTWARRKDGLPDISCVQDTSPDGNATSDGLATGDDQPGGRGRDVETQIRTARRRPSFQMVDTTVTLFNVGGMTGPRVNADAETKVRDERSRSSRRLPK